MAYLRWIKDDLGHEPGELSVLTKDADYFYELQTQTGWGRTLAGFAEWCAPEIGWLTLDCGCGPGLLSAIISKRGCKAIGVDHDPNMFRPSTLQTNVAVADVNELPFKSHIFNLISATNLLFLLPEPVKALSEMRRVLLPGGKIALLNPSENLNVKAAKAFAEERQMDGLARDTFLNWARRAEENSRWTEEDTRSLYQQAGLKFMEGIFKVGPGFALFSWGTT